MEMLGQVALERSVPGVTRRFSAAIVAGSGRRFEQLHRSFNPQR